MRILLGGLVMAAAALCQNTPTGTVSTGIGPYVPGVTFQTDNPNYLNLNPFYFEGRVDWNLLNITTPSTPWEFTQRGIHYQDDLQDTADAIADYQTAVSLNSLSNNTCQLIVSAALAAPNASLNPPPCMFTPRLRLAHLLLQSSPDAAIALYRQVLQIDPLRLGVNAYIGEAYDTKAAADPTFLSSAIEAYQAELALSPVTAQYTALTADKANNAHVHWALAADYAQLGDRANQARELQAYLDATQWHSDTYAWHIQLAKIRLAGLNAQLRRATDRAK